MMASNLATSQALRVLQLAPVARELTILGEPGPTRIEVLNNREHLVVPVVALMEGVVHPVNSEVPEFVPGDELARSVHSWNGRPIVGGHPKINGEWVSANNPTVLATAFGQIFNARIEKKTQLHMDSWFDIERAKANEIGASVLTRLEAKKPIELSTGVFMSRVDEAGTFNGRSFSRKWRNIIGDHLAFLREGERGACSNAMGCGIRVNCHRMTDDGIVAVTEEEPVLGQGMLERLTSLFKNDRSVIIVNAAGSSQPEGRNNCGCQGAGKMDKAKRIQALIDTKKFTEADKPWLEAVPEDKLATLEAAVKEKVETPEEKAAREKAEADKAAADKKAADDKAAADKKAADDKAAADKTTDPVAAALAGKQPLTAEQFMSLAPPELRETLQDSLRVAQERRDTVLAALKATGRCKFTDDELKAMSTNRLEQMLELAGGAPAEPSFAGRPAPRMNAEGAKTVTAPPSLFDKMKTGSESRNLLSRK